MLGHKAKIDFSTTGLMQQAIHLSPYFPNQLIKLGAKGVLSVRIIAADSEFPDMPNALTSHGTRPLRGIYMNHFPAETPEEIVSVNGVGDTFFGVLLGKLSKASGWNNYEKYILDAQKAACLTLASRESVNPEIRIGKNKAKRTLVPVNMSRDIIPQSHIIRPGF